MSFRTCASLIHRALLHTYPDSPIKLGQIHQLLSAALGHNSFASFQNAQSEGDLGHQIIVNRRLLLDRCSDLDISGSLAEEFLRHFKAAAPTIVYLHEHEYVAALMEFARNSIPKLPSVQDHVGRIGARISYVEVHPIEFPLPMGIHSPILHAISATVETSSVGTRRRQIRKLDFDGCVAVKVHNRRCLGAFTLTGNLVDADGRDQEFEYGYLPADD